MNREILFKAKRLGNNEWVEGYYMNLNRHHYIFIGKLDIMNGHPELVKYVIDPKTLCQFTGIMDYNNNKVWENDIVEINEDVRKIFDVSDGKVKYIGGSFVIGNGDGIRNSLMCLVDVCYILRGKVLGNAFDNPELLNKTIEEGF